METLMRIYRARHGHVIEFGSAGHARSRTRASILDLRIRMASDLLRSMLSFVLTDSTFTGVSERSKVSLQQTENFIKKVSGPR